MIIVQQLIISRLALKYYLDNMKIENFPSRQAVVLIDVYKMF